MSALTPLWPQLLSAGVAALPSLFLWHRMRRLEDRSNRDYQTGLRSGRLFDDDAELICRSPSPIALLLIDLDDFGAFNLQGYRENGDAKLLLAARTISAVLARRADRIYRMHYAGDEFLVLLTPKGRRHAYFQAERVRRALELAAVPASIGLAYASGSLCRDPRFLLRLVTTNKDAAKKAGKNRVYPPLDPPPVSVSISPQNPLPAAVNRGNETTAIFVGELVHAASR